MNTKPSHPSLQNDEIILAAQNSGAVLTVGTDMFPFTPPQDSKRRDSVVHNEATLATVSAPS